MFIDIDENGELLNHDATKLCLCIKRDDIRLCLVNGNLDIHFLEGCLEKLINIVDLIPTD